MTARLLKFPKTLIMGKNNYIESGVKICENVIIGDNNKIYDGTVIYPNTQIGDNNVILNNNILGEHPVEANEIFTGKKHGELIIGNYNFLHVNNLIFSGHLKTTKLGNNNKILAESHIGHDTHIHNNVVLYPRVITGGLSTLMNYSTMGMYASIQQNAVLGSFSMIGMGNIASHNVFPFYIYFNQKYLRTNTVKIPHDLNIGNYEHQLMELITELKQNKCDKNCIGKYQLSLDIRNYIHEFIDTLSIKKI